MRKIAFLLVAALVCLDMSAQINQYKNSSQQEIVSFWNNILGENKKYKKLVKEDNQKIRALRSEFNENSQLAVTQIEDHDGFFTDDIFLTDYITNLVQLLSGGIDERNGTLATANIMKESNPNACAYPNGSLVFNTRLIAMMDCEEELLGVIAHEMAHYKLEHALTNFIEIEKKTKKSKRWANFASIATTALGTVADIAAGGDGVGGMASGALMGMAVGEAIYTNLENMGYKFSQEQELEADRVAVSLLEHIGVSPVYYASALDKLRQEDYRFGREIVKTKKKSTHPALDERIAKIGNLEPVKKDKEFTKKIAEVLTIDAFVERAVRKDYKRTMAVLKRISEATQLSLDDYLIMIPTMIDMSNSPDSNKETLSLIKYTMKNFDHSEIESLSKYEAMLYVRLKEKDQARNALNQYLAYCNTSLSKDEHADNKSYFQKEKMWAENTLKRL